MSIQPSPIVSINRGAVSSENPFLSDLSFVLPPLSLSSSLFSYFFSLAEASIPRLELSSVKALSPELRSSGRDSTTRGCIKRSRSLLIQRCSIIFGALSHLDATASVQSCRLIGALLLPCSWNEAPSLCFVRPSDGMLPKLRLLGSVLQHWMMLSSPAPSAIEWPPDKIGYVLICNRVFNQTLSHSFGQETLRTQSRSRRPPLATCPSPLSLSLSLPSNETMERLLLERLQLHLDPPSDEQHRVRSLASARALIANPDSSDSTRGSAVDALICSLDAPSSTAPWSPPSSPPFDFSWAAARASPQMPSPFLRP